MLTTNPAVDEIGLDELESRDPGAMLLDVREPVEYALGHVPGAVNLPQADLADRLEELPRDRPVAADLPGRLSLTARRPVPQADWVCAGRQRRRRHGRLG